MRIVSHKKLKKNIKTKGHKDIGKITTNQYEFALARIEELLPVVNEDTPTNGRDVIELSVWSDIVIAYEKEYFPIEKPSVSELIEFSLEEKGMTQKQLSFF